MHPVRKLGERSQQRGYGNYQEAYTTTETCMGEQAWRVTIRDNETAMLGASDTHTSKKKAVKQAAERLLAQLLIAQFIAQ